VGRPSANIEVSVEPNGDTDLKRVGTQGIFASVSLEGESSGQHRVALDSAGDLFFDPAPLADGLATSWRTGEQIDLSHMQQIGRLTLDVFPDEVPVDSAPRNGCDVATNACSVLLPALNSSGPVGPPSVPGAPPSAAATLPVPVSSLLSCVAVISAGRQMLGYELDTGSYRLRFAPYGGFGVPWDKACASRDMVAGEALSVWVYTQIQAVSRDGLPLSVVATRDGRLYVGDVTLDVDCPCQPGN
jgi:hypothetical protein